MIETLSKLGGIFAVLTFIHFVVDFIPQSHSEAMAKSTNAVIRARHCLVYSLGFIPILLITKISLVGIMLCFSILFFSHFLQDTYISVILWAKYIRKPPQLVGSKNLSKDEVILAFKEWASTPLGILLIVVVDQITHLAFLWPIAWILLFDH